MDKKILIVVGILVVAIVAVGLYLHFDDKDIVDADPGSWEIYEEQDDALSLLDNRKVTPLANLDDAKKGDTVMIGKAWSDTNLNQSVKEKINAMAESGVRIITLGSNLAPFSVFMEKHSYEFEDNAYVNGVYVAGGTPVTISITVPTEDELYSWLNFWDKPITLSNFRNSTVAWELMFGSLMVRSFGDDYTILKSTQYVTDPKDTDYILAVEECITQLRDMGDGKVMIDSLKQTNTVTDPGTDSILEFAPTAETYDNDMITMTAHGRVDVYSPHVSNTFSHVKELDKRIVVNYSDIKSDVSDRPFTVYPSYIAKTGGDMTVDCETSLVLDRVDMDEKQRYTYGSVICLKERA